jgi:hypothetical protein
VLPSIALSLAYSASLSLFHCFGAGFRRDRDNEVAPNSAIGFDANELWCLDGAAVECVHAARCERTLSRSAHFAICLLDSMANRLARKLIPRR